MQTHPLTAKNWMIVALVAVAIGIWFVAPFLSAIAIAALMAFLFHGSYERLLRTMKPGAAASITFLFSLAVVVIPIILIGTFTAFQVARLAADLTSYFGTSFTSLPATVQTLINELNRIAAPIVGSETILSGQSVIEFLRNTLPAVIGAITGFLASLIGGIPTALIMVILYIFLFYEFLVYGKKITGSIVALSPFQPEVTRLYLARVGLMANAMVKGQLVIAFIGAVLSAATLGFFLNLWDYFLLMTVIFTLFNLIPLGAGIIAYPIMLIALLLGMVWPAIGALIVFTLISNLDTILRPKFIPRSITLSNSLTMLAAFGGIALYGLLGVVYGPIIMIVIVTSVQMYLEYYQDAPLKSRKAAKRTL
jgi:predicted PurR-regulated permease PerM